MGHKIYAVRIIRLVDTNEENFGYEECHKKYFDTSVTEEQLVEHLNSITVIHIKDTFLTTQILIDALPKYVREEFNDPNTFKVWVKYI